MHGCRRKGKSRASLKLSYTFIYSLKAKMEDVMIVSKFVGCIQVSPLKKKKEKGGLDVIFVSHTLTKDC